MKRTILAMTVLAAFACTAQTSSSTPSSSSSSPQTQTQTQPSNPSTTSPDMQQSPQSTNPSTPDMQSTPQTTTPTSPDMQSNPSSNPNANPNQRPSTTMPQSDQPGAASSGQSASAATGTGQSYEGCLKEKKGEYWLMSNDGSKYHVSSTSDLSAHKNHEVRVTGDVASAASSMSGNANATAQSLNATNVEDVSSTCKMGNKGNMSNPSSTNPSSSNPSTYPK